MVGNKNPQTIENMTQRVSDSEHDFLDAYYDYAANIICANTIAILENGPTQAIIGNANDIHMADAVINVKGADRRGNPLALTMPFWHPLLEGAFKTDHVKDSTMRDFLENPEQLSERLGAIAFKRGPLDPENAERNGIPACTVAYSSCGETGTLQNYDPYGNDVTEGIIYKMDEKGAVAAMTSANYHKQPEITTTEEAEVFSRETGLYYIRRPLKAQTNKQIRSSYPIVGYNQDGFYPVRDGFLHPEVLHRLMADMPQAEYDHQQVIRTNYPENVITMADLGKDHIVGNEVRKRILEELGLQQ